MARSAKRRVFISYARKDGADLAQRLQQDLSAIGFDVWLDVRRLRGGANWSAEIEAEIDRSDAVVALLTPGSYISDICRAEQMRALRKKRSVIPILAVQGADTPVYLETKNYRDFTRSYNGALKALAEDIRLGRGAVRLAERYRQTYVTAPPLPRTYMERPDELSRLRDALVVDESGRSIALTALRGMGGIGKTVLAQAVAYDDAVQNAFPDGIAWVTIGNEQTYDLSTYLREVRRALGDEPAEKETELECINRYKTALETRAALVIVDDVWRVEDLEPFLAASRRSRVLFTTRDGSIAGAVGAEEHVADLLTEEQSKELLSRWAGWNGRPLPAAATDVIRECGRLPLALSMIGAMLREKPMAFWPHVLDLLRHAELQKFTKVSGYAHATLMRALQGSVEALDEQARERYVSLAVLLEDMPAHPLVQRALWGTDDDDCLETAELFVSRSLAQRVAEDGAIRLHDLQLDYVRRQWADKESLELIRGAIRLAAHVIERDPAQFASQMVGRLAREDMPVGVRVFADKVIRGAPRPFLCPLRTALHPPGTGLLRTLEGHSAKVLSVAVTPDGRRAVSASSDHTLKVWDLESGHAFRTLEGHSGAVTGVAVTPDGRRAVSASSDGTLKVWDLESGRAFRALEGHSGAVSGVAVTPDGRRAVSASSDHTLKVWDLESGRALRTFEGHSQWVFAVAVTPDGRRAVSASSDGTLKVWDLESGCTLRTLEGDSGPVSGVAVTPDGRYAVSASSDRTLKVWELESGCTLRTLKGHSDWVDGVAVTADGRRAISASADLTLKVWDLESGCALLTLEGHSGAVHGVAVTADGRRAVSASSDETLKVWDLGSGCGLRTLEGHSDAISSVAVTPDGRRAVSGSYGTLKVWDLGSGRSIHTLSDGVFDVAVTPEGRRAVSASYSSLKVWDLASGRVLRTLEGHSSSVTGVAVTADGRRAVSASYDQTLKVWDLESGRTLRTLEGHSRGVTGVAVTADGRRAVSASFDRTLKVWDLESGRALRTLEGHSAPVLGVAVTPDGRRAVSASSDQTLKVWDLESGRALRTLEGHSDGVDGVAVTADGRRAVSASNDKTLKVWDLESGLVIAAFTADAGIHRCACTTDNHVVAGDAGGQLHILRLEFGNEP